MRTLSQLAVPVVVGGDELRPVKPKLKAFVQEARGSAGPRRYGIIFLADARNPAELFRP